MPSRLSALTTIAPMRAAQPVALILAAALGGSALMAEELAQPVQVQEIARSQVTAAGQPIHLPAEGVEVVASVYTIAPGAELPVHSHRYARYAYVMSGELEVVAAEGGHVFTYRPGDFIIEMTGAWHWGRNRGAEPVKLVVVDQTEPGLSNTELKQE
jgi:quercetin dioxygenase-like cupin family protein